jgi:hypothetical protein
LTVALRRRRAAITQAITLLVTCLAAVGAGTAHTLFGDPARQGALPFGRDMVVAALTALCVLLAFMAPALTATSISEERERRTLDLLLCSRMRPVDLVLGKLAAGVVQGLLFVAASLPSVAFGWLYGGIPALHVLLAYALVLVLLALLLATGLFASARAPASKVAVTSTYGISLALLMPLGLPALALTGVGYATGQVDVDAAVTLGVVAVVVGWLAAGCVLGSVTAVSPVSRDPSPAARGVLLSVAVSAVLAALGAGALVSTTGGVLPGGVLLGGTLVVVMVAAVLFSTEDPPARPKPTTSWPWRGNPWTGTLWVLLVALLLALVLPPALFHRLPAYPLTPATALALVPAVASVAGVGLATRVLPWRRPARRALALAVLAAVGLAPPALAFVTGHTDLTVAPAAMLLWLHPATLVLATAPSATPVAPAVGPLGVDLQVAFTLGHLLLAGVCATAGALWGQRSPRMA